MKTTFTYFICKLIHPKQPSLFINIINNVLGLKPTDSMTSFGSTFSVYSNIEDKKGEYDISGEVLVRIELQQETLLTINRAKGLAATDKHGLSNPLETKNQRVGGDRETGRL